MRITVHSQHGHIPESLQSFASSKMEVLGKFLSTIATIDVEVDRDGHVKSHASYLIRVTVATSGPVFRSRVTCEDPAVGIDVAVERLSRRLKEFKRRRSGRPLHSRSKTETQAGRMMGSSGIPAAAADEDTPGIVDSRRDAD